MILRFLGSGSAFTTDTDNYQSNMLLENEQGEKLLIDCGTDIRWSLSEAGFTPFDIQHVYVSHLHGDHVGGLEWLAFSTIFDKRCRKPVLYVSETLVVNLWEHVLAGGLLSLEEKQAQLETYFEVHAIKNNAFIWQGAHIDLVPTRHYKSNGVLMPTYGLFFTANRCKIWMTNDSQFTPDTHLEYYLKADLIFHDCETSRVHSGLHAHYEELVTLPKEIKKKIWLYHYNNEPLPDALKDGFKGFVKKGQLFDFAKMEQ